MARLCIINAKIILPDKIVFGSILVRNKKIIAVDKKRALPRGSVQIDARGNFVAPGFIDLHIHGDIAVVSRQQVRGGTTGFLATLHPARKRELLEKIAAVIAQKDSASCARCLGIRLEGPFLNRDFCGALPAALFRAPTIREAQDILKCARGFLKMVVVAPELPGALRVIRFLRKHSVVASLGHSGATYAQALEGIDAGIGHATHTFNRMRAFDHKEPGALTAVLTDQRVACEVIADGVHVHPAAMRLLWRCKGEPLTMLVSDSTSAQTTPPKKRYGAVFKLADGTLYGSALTLNKALQNAVRFLGLSLPQAVQLVALNPAKTLGIDARKGSIAPGKDADLVMFDKSFKVKMTFVEGSIVYNT